MEKKLTNFERIYLNMRIIVVHILFSQAYYIEQGFKIKNLYYIENFRSDNMYQRCDRPGFEPIVADRNCRPRPEDIDNIEVERKNYEIEDSINSSINNSGILVQLQIGALIIFDDVFGSGIATALNNADGSPFELKLDENGNVSINGNKFDVESSDNGAKTIVIRNGKVSTV